MNIFRNDEILFEKKTILTVGSFDGIHTGHQELIKILINRSKKQGFRNLLVTFEPHPQIVLNRFDKPIKILSSIEEKLNLLDMFGIDNVWIIDFNQNFSQTEPEDFIKEYLIEKSGVSEILIGYDHMFGRNRDGNIELMKEMSGIYDFTVNQISAFIDSKIPISSTRIRNLIENSEIEETNKLLGRNYNLLGKVIKGEERGRKMGFPTANILPDNPNKLLPGNGVYIVKSEIEGQTYYGMANIGLRPTFADLLIPLTEVHFFDLDMNLYDKYLNIEFLRFVREEKKFAAIDQLVGQINFDKNYSLDFIKNYE